MASSTGNKATATELIPAGHAESTAEDELGENESDGSTGLVGLSVAALGVVFGDIGTSRSTRFVSASGHQCRGGPDGRARGPKITRGFCACCFASVMSAARW